jgi:hypothetical protein
MEGSAFATMSGTDIRRLSEITYKGSHLEELTTEDFAEQLSEFIDPVTQKTFFDTIVRTYALGSKIVQEEEGHGMTYIIANEGNTPTLDRYARNSKPFNGTGHNVFDDDAYRLIKERRGRDLAVLVGSDGSLRASNLHLPADPLPLQERYGISEDISAFMNYTSTGDDYLGARKGSAWTASLMMVRPVKDSEGIEGEIIALTFGEESGTEVFYCGHRISNRRGDVAWERAEREPNVRRRERPEACLSDVLEERNSPLERESQYSAAHFEAPGSYC